MSKAKKYKIRTKPEPFFIIEIKVQEGINIKRIIKNLPKESSQLITTLEREGQNIRVEFKTEVNELPRFEGKDKGIRILSYLDVSNYDFETFIYPLLKTIFEENGGGEMVVTLNMLQMTGLHISSPTTLSWREQQLTTKMYADTYRYIFSLSTSNKNSIRKEWKNFIQSLEKLGGLPEGTIYN